MPSIAKITTSKVLTTVMVGRAAQGFVAEQYAPSTLVNNRSGKIYSAGKEGLRDIDAQMKSGVKTNRVDFDYSEDTYTTKKQGLHTPLDTDLLDNADQPINLRADATNLLTGIIMLKHEVAAAALAQATGTITSAGATAKWDAASGQKPRDDMDTGKEVIRAAAGRYPNAAIFPPACRNAYVNYLLVTAQVSYGELARTMELPPLVQGMVPIVPLVVKDSAALGQTASLSEVYTATIVTLCIVDSPSLIYSGAFLNIRRTKVGPKGFRVRQWWDEEIETEVVECQTEQIEKTVNVDGAYCITTVT